MTLVKIDKRSARKEYNNGNKVNLLPSKAAPGSMWITPFSISNACGEDFDKVVNEYAYYNCTKETGLKVTYYIYR